MTTGNREAGLLVPLQSLRAAIQGGTETAPVAGAPARKTPVVANPNRPLTPALVQVAEPCFTANPSEKR